MIVKLLNVESKKYPKLMGTQSRFPLKEKTKIPGPGKYETLLTWRVFLIINRENKRLSHKKGKIGFLICPMDPKPHEVSIIDAYYLFLLNIYLKIGMKGV